MTANLQWLTDPTVFQVNRLDAHSDHIPYAAEAEAEAGESSLIQSLDGTWAFFWSKRPADRPADFWQENADHSAFATIQVPGHMETQGFGQIQYINKLYPWDGHSFLRPPQVDMDDNPVGSYVRRFDLEPGLQGKRVCISFQGVEQAFYVWLNGHFVGYSTDTFTPSDFDLTPYVRETGNTLCVEVYKRSCAGWMEDQDFFRFSGIFRPVFLYAKPDVHIDDVWFQAGLREDNTTGTLRIRLKLSGNTENTRIRCAIPGLYEDFLPLTPEDGYLVTSEFPFPNIKPWDYGTPNLYRATLTVYQADSVAEVVPYDIGFRRVEMKDGIMLLNGKRLMINGVNRHEWNPRSGRAITLQDMENAMEVILANNINAVRTCHYPDRSEWYHLCDQKGIYVMDEVNLEAHGSWQKDALPDSIEPSWNVPGSDPIWHGMLLDRANSMFQRDKNHASILFWSCGNEAFCGSNIVSEANFLRNADPSRLVHYEGVYFTRGVANGQPTSPHWKPEYETVSDMESRMYATPWDIRDYLAANPEKPYLSCEYMHNMGNSLGGMESYIRLGQEFPQYQGGFIWDYMDQALIYTDCQGREVLGYGGDFGERQSDYNFSGNGIVDACGNPKPCMQEVRYWHASEADRKLHDENNAIILKKMEENLLQDARVLEFLCSRAPALTITHGDGALGVKGKDFEILFSYSQAGPSSLRRGSTEWLWRGPRPAFWRAPTENDIGCGFPGRSSIWNAVEQYQKCTGWEILEESPDRCAIRYSFSADIMSDLRTDVTYSVDKLGRMDVEVHYFGAPNRPQLPLLGLRFATPRPVSQTTWGGLSGETYPDRYKGAKAGRFQEIPHIPNYLVPQECGNHMNTLWATLQTDSGKLGLQKLDKPFHFSAIPYTPQQLEQAFHAEELPAPTRTVITVCSAMRGVGGIDTWGSDVEQAYHVPSHRDITLNFRISL